MQQERKLVHSGAITSRLLQVGAAIASNELN